MACKKNHIDTDQIIKDLPISQGNFERHKCASCAYEKGLQNGAKKLLNFDLEDFITNLEKSQKGFRRHRSAIEAYTLGFFHGLNGDNNHLAIKDKSRIASQMRDFGLSMVAKGVVNATFSEMGEPYSHAMGLVQVANGFEILIKSKIVEEHPLLVFTKIPKEANLVDGNIKMEDLLEHGQTIMYSELPDRLWATTGYKIESLDLYNKFGRIRNQIIHFAIPQISLANLTLEYTFKIIEKAINTWWDVTILDYAQEYDDVILEYIFERIEDLGLKTIYTVDNNFHLKKK
ncbi:MULTISPECIES: hypothetical protein [Aequorivita]|uniref:Uncharacterized protein n=1 Tax=Aequorivita iocasae TaxID=2803865 RepID=A0ABX7DTH7_9FLAO|nr:MULTISPECIES: hypothetical protein [Aequorivita]QQX76853.1 hypothetical protein JK629_00835 [Aequorivita iocasae]UCA56325.1 hypothetical protein LDL78_00840 [Aequorivita sp. F7]